MDISLTESAYQIKSLWHSQLWSYRFPARARRPERDANPAGSPAPSHVLQSAGCWVAASRLHLLRLCSAFLRIAERQRSTERNRLLRRGNFCRRRLSPPARSAVNEFWSRRLVRFLAPVFDPSKLIPFVSGWQPGRCSTGSVSVPLRIPILNTG